MAVNLNQNTDCCETTCTNTTVNTPGPQGATGASGSNGTNGTDGNNGYSVTSSSFVMPALGATTNVHVDQTGWIVATGSHDSQVIFIGDAGHFKAIGKGTNHITITPLYYTGDPASEGDTIASGKVAAPAGIQGPAGSAASELSSKGELLSRTSTALSALSVGANNKVLKADSSTPTGLVWGDVAASEVAGNIDLASQVTGTLPLASVGNTGGAAGDLLYWNGSNWIRLPAVAAGQVLLSQGIGAAPAYALPSTLTGVATYAAKGRFVCTSSGPSVTSNWTFNIASASHSYGAANHSSVALTFTDEVSVDLPIFAHYVDTNNTAGAGATSNADTIKTNITIQSRTTLGVTLSVLNGPTNPTFAFYIPN